MKQREILRMIVDRAVLGVKIWSPGTGLLLSIESKVQKGYSKKLKE